MFLNNGGRIGTVPDTIPNHLLRVFRITRNIKATRSCTWTRKAASDSVSTIVILITSMKRLIKLDISSISCTEPELDGSSLEKMIGEWRWRPEKDFSWNTKFFVSTISQRSRSQNWCADKVELYPSIMISFARECYSFEALRLFSWSQALQPKRLRLNTSESSLSWKT